jgi:hypothetical protein
MLLEESEVRKALAALEPAVLRYRWLQSRSRTSDVRSDAEFQRQFNGYYRLRRNQEWRSAYYKLMQAEKVERRGFAAVLHSLKSSTGRVEASFASKLVATIEPKLPVIDRYVLLHFGLRLPSYQASERELKTVHVYDELVRCYESLVVSPLGVRIRYLFNEQYGDHPITDLKKIDLVLWRIRR